MTDFFENESEEVLNIYQQESSEILQSMDESLTALKKDVKNSEYPLKLFREAHSLKGSARMMGFLNIQNVAHKIEDVVWAIKENKIAATPEITDTISSALDYISNLIDKTVANKKEYCTDEIEIYIASLEKIARRNELENAYVEGNFEEPDEDKKIILSKFSEIEALITEILLISSKYHADKDPQYADEIKNRLYGMFETFKKTSFEQITKAIQDIVEIIDCFVADNTNVEFSEIDLKIENLLQEFISLCVNQNIKTKNYRDIALNQISLFDKTDREEEQKIEIQKISADIDTDLANLIKQTGDLALSLKENKDNMPDLEENIRKIINKIDNPELKKTYKTILKMVKGSQAQDKVFDENILDAIYRIIEDSLYIFQNADLNVQDYEILSQRTLIIEQMLTSNLGVVSQRRFEGEQNKTVKTFSAQDWINSFDSSVIKTLRVDSSKLDLLVNQIGDLITTRIKNLQQLNLAKKFQNDLDEWYKNWHKIGYYIKYYDKKYLTGPDIHLDVQSVVAYNKQLMSLYNSHTERFVKMIEETNFLYKQLQENDSKLNAVTNEFESMIKKLRVLPLATIFHLFPRMVHNIAKEKGKEIDFKIEGSEVSADKKIIEEIKIPLMHIIRNSIDHGIETVQEREEAGKTPQGRITISAKHHENKIIIDIKDDGRGVDIEKVKAIALEKGLLNEQEADSFSNEQIVGLIFYPGFSTEENVTEISGRGLGLDIVRNKINQLNGKINVYSEFQKGTLIRIELPVAMATISAFIVSEQEQLFAIGTSFIKTVARIEPKDIFVKDNKNYFIYREKVTPIFTLSQILEMDNLIRYTNKYTVMILQHEEEIVGVIIDKLIGDEEILQKKLSLPLFKVKNISGITTIASGETCLILNVADIINTVLPQKTPVNIVTSNKTIEIEKNNAFKILVVDDSLTTRALQKNILKAYGYRVKTLSSPAEAFDLLKEESVNLIVTDYDMPDTDGVKFVEMLQKNKETAQIPIIVLTSFKIKEVKEKFDGLLVEEYIQKDKFNQNFFTEKISKILARRK